MAKLFNRAKMTTSTTGSGTVTLVSASNGFQSFADAGVSNGDVVQYVIEEGANFEIGTGTYSSTGTSLTRGPTESSNSGSAITLAGQATVSITAVADDLNRLQSAGTDIVTVSSTGATVTGDLDVAGYIYADSQIKHRNDTNNDTSIWFSEDDIEFYAGNVKLLRLKQYDASDDVVYIDAPIVTVARDISHDGDLDTKISFGTDNITFSAGGSEFIKLIEGVSDYVQVSQPLYLSAGNFITFEGSTADDFETSLGVANPTADRTITLPDATGTVALTDVATTSADGLMSSTDKSKLDGIEASADVTDTANVTSAGALMDSELTSEASVKAIDQGLATTDSPSFSSITIDGHTLQDSTNRSGLLQVSSSLGTWKGFSIASTSTSHWSIMGDQDDFGLYDDVNNEWILQYNENSTLQLYSNGTNTVSVTTTGLLLQTGKYILFEGSTADGFETFLNVVDPTADRTINLPNASGTVATLENAQDFTAQQTFSAGQDLDNDQFIGWGGGTQRPAITGNKTSNLMYFYTGGSTRLTIANSTITSTEPILAPYFEATSDINLKENIVQVEDAITKIQKLNGYTYNFKDEPEVAKAGLIAQEVQEVLPEAVRLDEDENLRLDYNGTIALLVEAIKAQQEQINDLKAKLN